MPKPDVVITRIFKVPIEQLFQAWVDPELMMQWYSPADMTTPHAEADPQVGGKYAVTMRFVEREPQEDVTVRGVYKQIQAPNRLQFTWQWDGQEGETLVDVALRPIDEQTTELTLTHSGFDQVELPPGFTRDDHHNGWSTAFTKLDRLQR